MNSHRKGQELEFTKLMKLYFVSLGFVLLVAAAVIGFMALATGLSVILFDTSKHALAIALIEVLFGLPAVLAWLAMKN